MIFHINDTSKERLEHLLLPEERVIDARPRSFWLRHRMLMIGTFVGTLAFVGLAIAALIGFTNRFLYTTMISVIFPILFLVTIVQGIR